MFKKKGGLAFKPKIPSTRPRPPPKQVETPVETPKEAPPPPPEILEPEPQTEILQPEPQPEKPPVPEAQPRTRRRSSAASSTKGLERTTRQAIANSTAADAPISVAAQTATPAPTQDTLQPVQEEAAASTTGANESIRTTRQARRASQLETPAPTPIPTPTEPIAVETAPSQPITSIETLPTLAPKPRGRRRASTAAEEPSAGSEAAPARPAKRAKKTQATSADGTTEAPKRRRKSSAANATDGEGTPKPRRGRSATPEDSEAQVVDLQKLKMSDLTKDLHIGKKFSRHDELRDRERRARAKSKSAKEESATDSRSGTPIQKNGSVDRDPPPPAAPGPAPSSGPQFRIVDGQIVVDQSSLVMDRHARAAAAQAGQTMETIEENDFTRLITSSSYMNTSKLRGPNVWTEHDTELFYRGLSMLGTDFEMIAQMIPGKQRRHVKLKFNREERHNPQRINSALIGEKTIKIDMDEYQAATGAEFESVEVIEAEQRKIEETYEAERQRVADEQAEIMRKKREELFADEDAAAVKKKKRGGKKEKVQYGLNGEPIVTE